MRITTKIVLDMETLGIIESHGYEYCGSVDKACGASGEQKAAYQNELGISNLMKSTFQQFAGTNTAMLNELIGNLTPIQQAGPSQFGLSPTAEAAERTSTAEQMAAAGAQTSNAVRQGLASEGGGTNYLPSGASASILGSLAQNQAVQEAMAQSGITQQGYNLGRQNWQFATQGLESAPGAFENPVTSAGGTAIGAAGQQMQGATDITQANQAWMAPVAGIIGAGLGAAGKALGQATPSSTPQGGGGATGAIASTPASSSSVGGGGYG